MTGADNPDRPFKPSPVFKKWEREWKESKKFKCPVCGHFLIHVRFWNEKVMGKGKDNPFQGWVCQNHNCKGWYCEMCQKYHPYGTSCLGSRSENWRMLTDPNWRHRERDLYENKYKALLEFMRKRK